MRNLLLLLVCACASLPAQTKAPQSLVGYVSEGRKPLPNFPGIVEMVPPPFIYWQWWKEIAECQHLPLPFDIWRVRFFAVNANQFHAIYVEHGVVTTNPDWSVGVEFDSSAQIYLAVLNIRSKRLVTHEMSHYLLFKSGFKIKMDHPFEYFNGRCFGVRQFFVDSTDISGSRK